MTFARLALSFFLICVVAAPCQAASPTPEEIIDAFFGPSGIADKAAYYTGEMKESHVNDPTLGQGFVAGVTFTSRQLALSPPDAPVYAVTIRHGDELFDWYAYFAWDEGYLKLKAVRTLGLSGIPYMAMQELGKLRSRTAEQEWQYQNLRQAFRSDQELIAHFRTEIAELDALKSLIDAKQADAVHEKMRSMHFSGYEHGQYGHLQIWIGGGLLNSVVGVLHCPATQMPLPPMNEHDYIYIEHVEGPWYLYKTT
jgi:hypothetical protein